MIIKMNTMSTITVRQLDNTEIHVGVVIIDTYDVYTVVVQCTCDAPVTECSM